MTMDKSAMQEAKKSLDGNWLSVAFGTFLWDIYIGLFLLATGIVGILLICSVSNADAWEDLWIDLLVLIVSVSAIGPFSAGYVNYLLDGLKYKRYDHSRLLSGFQNFGKTFMIGFYSWGIIFLSMVLCVGGVVLLHFLFPSITDNIFSKIIVAVLIAYVLISVQLRITWIPYFIYVEDGCSKSAWSIVRESWNLMDGKEWSLFLLLLRFTGWNLLAIVTFGLGWFWVFPYTVSSIYYLYLDLKKNTIEVKGSKTYISQKSAFVIDDWSVEKKFTVGFIIVFWSLFIGLACS
ncbi:MAG: DUF975 family protein [Bacteroides sp.]|nr:DUF975 family protein [Bacteroides sp.]